MTLLVLESHRAHLAFLIENLFFFFFEKSREAGEKHPPLNQHVEFSWQP